MYHILHDHPEQSLMERLFHIRNIGDNLADFLQPTFQRYRTPRQLFDEVSRATDKIITTMRSQEKIMIFGDYDVDGIMSTFLVYTFFRDYVKYPYISLRLPHRVRDGYGIKKHHLDEIIATGTKLVITVDNGITAVEESRYAKELGIDLIITDHHKPLDTLPEGYACLNPQCVPDHPFKEVCGAVVASKLCLGIADALGRSKDRKYARLTDMLPYLTIATIADCMPLIGENRLIVKEGFDLINNHRAHIHAPLRSFLAYLNLEQVDTFHVGFVIAPRLNATGRVGHALDGLKALLTKDPLQQRLYLEHMDTLNGERKKIQEQMIQHAEASLDHDQPLLWSADSSFHEGIVGIVSGRVTEKYNKPSLIMSINPEEGVAMGSLRGPERFNIVDMLKTADDLLLRYGGHAQAGGLTVAEKDITEIIERFCAYCTMHPAPDLTSSTIEVDTPIYSHEMERETLKDILAFGPYGEGNPEPLFVLESVHITQIQTVGKNGSSHLKLRAQKDDKIFTSLQRGKGESAGQLNTNTPVDLLGKIKQDTFNGGWYLEAKHIIDSSSEQSSSMSTRLEKSDEG